MRQLIEVLRNNYAVGMTLDQGGRAGVLVKFFGKPASMAAAAVRLALKYDTAIIPGFSWRQKGARLKLVFGQPFNIKKTKDSQKDIRDNLQELSRILEKNVSRHPQEYLWSHKIWKYSDEKNILILSDGKTGHLRQAQQVASLVYRSLKEKDIKGSIDTVEVSYRGPISKFMMKFGSCLSSRFSCQGCLWCLRSFLEKESYLSLIRQNPDIIISCGSAVAPVNLVLSRESLAKSIVIMRPSILSTRRFDLVILPRHDNPRQSGNIIVTEGALNLIDDQYLQEQSQRLLGRSQSRILDSGLYLGLLVGGDTKDFHLEQETVSKVIQQIRLAADDLDAQILATTSRRTPKVIEELLKEALKDNPRCRLLVIANEKNIPEAVGGILGLSSIVITTPESMSMVSEAVSSKKYVLVFDAKGIRGKRRRFLRHFARNNYINLVEPDNLCRQIKELWRKKPARGLLRDNLLVSESIRKKIA